jgi:hypothetical protein
MKKCSNSKCTEPNPQPLDRFYKNKSKADGLNIHCKSCSRKYTAATERKHKEKYNKQKKIYWAKHRERLVEMQRRNMLWSAYKITPDQWQQMFISQNGTCKICRVHASQIKKPLAVDHCHKTGKVRGLLCYHCNWLIGHAKEDVEVLQKAIEYLNK